MDSSGVAGPQPPLPERRNAVTAETLETGNNGTNRRPKYWCHSCQMQVIVRIIEETKEVECIACTNSFVEEMEETEGLTPDRTQHTEPGSAQRGFSSGQVSSRQTSNRQQRRANVGLPNIIHQLIRSLHSNTQDPVAVYLHGNSVPGIFNFSGLNVVNEIASDLGDYHFGSGAALDALLNQLMQADQNNRGTPPAAKEVIDSLPKKEITMEHINNNTECAVCKDNFKVGDICNQLPCNHIFCPDCIQPWLKEHNTCPVCRYELPTDDPEYERIRKERIQSRPQTNGLNPASGASDSSSAAATNSMDTGEMD